MCTLCNWLVKSEKMKNCVNGYGSKHEKRVGRVLRGLVRVRGYIQRLISLVGFLDFISGF